MLTKPDSLVSQIYKSRYYPKDSFLNAKIGSNPSFIWRSIIENQELLRAGTGRRVGSGADVDVLQDPWLPCEDFPFVQTHNEALKGIKVSALMNVDHHRWDIDLIRDMFNNRDANLILSIPIQHKFHDSWYWTKEKLGHYSVKTAYAAITEVREGGNQSDNFGF